MILTGENQSSQRKTCPIDTLFTTNLIWTGLGIFFYYSATPNSQGPGIYRQLL